MSGFAGRKVRIKYYASGFGSPPGAVIAGARADAGSLNNEPIDITDKDDTAWRTLLDDIGLKSMEMTCSGVLSSTQLIDLFMAQGDGSTLADFGIEIIGLGEFQSKFMMSALSVSGDEGPDPTTFEATFMSSGAITFTAA